MLAEWANVLLRFSEICWTNYKIVFDQIWLKSCERMFRLYTLWQGY